MGRYAEDLMRDYYFAVTTYITGLVSAFARMPTISLTLESVIELAKEIELRLAKQEGSQSTQYTIIQIGFSSQ